MIALIFNSMKKNQLLILFAVLSLLFSCSDLQRKEHLAAIKGMRTSLDSLEKVLQDNQIDTLAGLITATMSLELRIKNNYESDTINMEFGRKMDAFKRARKSSSSWRTARWRWMTSLSCTLLRACPTPTSPQSCRQRPPWWISQ